MDKTNTDNKQAVHSVDRVNLYDFGYEKSGEVKGDPAIFSTYLQRIADGNLVEEDYKGFSDEEKKDRKEKLKELEQKRDETLKQNETIQKEIDEKEKKIDTYRQQLLNIHEGREQEHEKLKKETFSPFKFSLNLIILAALSVYLFFFYISAAYKALYTDFEAIAANIAEGIGTGSIMPGAYELAEALQYNYLLLLVPFVFYAFGWAFHVLLEMEHKLKYLFIGLLIAVTFVVDFLLAMIIHNNTETAKDLMGLDTVPLSQSPTFYIILFLGFLVYIIWSILLDSLLREWDKKQVTYNLKRIVKHLKEDVKRLQAKLYPIEEIDKYIAYYREDINTVFVGNLKKYIDQFASGWLSYLAPANMKDVKNQCMHAKKDFEDKHQIKTGTVKVISKKK
ncbi:MAG: hypothetical protein GVY19_02570 [Bacteroidetes bacterium]|jgi:uncharacterized membrane protein YqhA|nr:hypothetical protein [Bacteroidota bacterium]